jgi:nucleoside-diphosphate-sugar epimerase
LNIFVAGATGVIGVPLVKLLRAAGHTVTGGTRSPTKVAAIEALGATPAVVDVFDAAAFLRAVVAARPEVVIHQLTNLPDVLDPAERPAVLARNSKLRDEGTRNLMAAASSAGARRVVAQSIAFVYAPGPLPHTEDDPLDPGETQRATVTGVVALEQAVLGTPSIAGVVLRYGRLYGPGTWFAKSEAPGGLSTDAAAHAALLAVDRGAPGLYNIAEDDGAVSIDKARRQLGFDPNFRM